MSQDLFSLPVLEQLSAQISRRRVGDLPVIVIDHPRVRAAVALQGAQVIAWQPAGEEPVLWLSEASAFREGTAIRGGVPVCWPWFGSAGAPSHGFARVSAFELVSADEDEQGARLVLALRSDVRTRALWPHEFTLLVRVEVGETCEITIEAQGDYPSTAALHSYFTVGDVHGVAVSGLGGHYVDEIDGTEGHLDGDLTFPDRIDRLFTAPEESTSISDPVLGRVIEVRHRGNSDVVSWNPGPELSISMADLTDDGYRGFVCVETARVSEPMVSAPEKPAALTATISVTRGRSSVAA